MEKVPLLQVLVINIKDHGRRIRKTEKELLLIKQDIDMLEAGLMVSVAVKVHIHLLDKKKKPTLRVSLYT